MSELDEPRIRCTSCRKNVPAMKYCIYCGNKLQEKKQIPIDANSNFVSPPTKPIIHRQNEFLKPKPELQMEDKVNTIKIDIVKLYEMKASLLEILSKKEVSENIFVKLEEEYIDKLNKKLDEREKKLNELKNDLKEKTQRLENVKRNLEEFTIRNKIGEIADEIYEKKASILRTEIRILEETLMQLTNNIYELEHIFSKKKPIEIKNLENKIKESLEILEKLLVDKKISEETLTKIKPEIKKTLLYLDSLISNRKEKENVLQGELETLTTRYKISEISIEEYERNKREIQSEINKVWD